MVARRSLQHGKGPRRAFKLVDGHYITLAPKLVAPELLVSNGVARTDCAQEALADCRLIASTCAARMRSRMSREGSSRTLRFASNSGDTWRDICATLEAISASEQ